MSIPYMGSKRKLVPKIVNTIFQRHGNKPFYDVFGGGGAVSIEALRYFDEVHYNEIDTAIVNLIEQLKIGIPDYWYEPVSREKFFEEIEKIQPMQEWLRPVGVLGIIHEKDIYGVIVQRINCYCTNYA